MDCKSGKRKKESKAKEKKKKIAKLNHDFFIHLIFTAN